MAGSGSTGARLLAAVVAVILAGSCASGSGGARPSPSPGQSQLTPSPAAPASPTSEPSPDESVLPASPTPPPPSEVPSPAASPVIAEWQANLRANPQTFVVRRSVALLDLDSGRAVATVPAGEISVAYETSVGGRAFWMTEYSVSHGVASGLLKEEVAAAVAAAPALPGSLVGNEWSRLPTTDRVVALTFDCGGSDAGVAAVLAALAAAGAPATFFMTGRWAEVYPQDARLISASYRVGNHTYSHPDLTTLSDAQVANEVATGEAAIENATGSDPHPLFRFPYGARDARTITGVNAMGYGGIRWTVDTLGWKGASGGQSTDSVVQRVVGGLQPGEIVLMHVGAAEDGTTLDATALPKVIEAIHGRGYRLVAVADYL